MDTETFYDALCKLTDQHDNRDTETWLLALYALVLREKDSDFSLEKALLLFDQAYTASPAPFEVEWLGIVESPDPNRISRKFTHPDLTQHFDKSNLSVFSGLEFTLEVLKFQSAELHKMRGKQLDDPYKELGITSETGHDWYNFTPSALLECGARCMVDEEFSGAPDWSFIGELLENGRVYE